MITGGAAYDPYDVFCPTLTFDDGGATIAFVEDGGVVQTATLTFSRTLEVDEPAAAYVATATDGYDATGGAPSSHTVIAERLYVRPLYDEIAYQLTQASSAGATYTCSAQTPAGSDLDNSGLRIENDGGVSFAIAFDDAAHTLPPEVLGWPSDAATTAGGDPLDSPLSRYGVWQAPVGAHDRRGAPSRQTFSTTSNPVFRERFGWSPTYTTRSWIYFAVPAAHVWSYGRHDEAAATYAGLPSGDRHNGAQQLWHESLLGHEPHNWVLCAPSHDGTLAVLDADDIAVAKLGDDFGQVFDPMEAQSDGSRQDKLPREQYALKLPLAEIAPGEIDDQWSVWRY